MKIERNFHEGALTIEAREDGTLIRRERFHKDVRMTQIARYSEGAANVASLYEGEGKVSGLMLGSSLELRYNASRFGNAEAPTYLAVSSGTITKPEDIDAFIELLNVAKAEWARIEQ